MKKQEKGQTLIEILAALAVVIIVILALIAVVTASIRNATFAKNQSLATQYAQESIEEARELRNGNKDDFFDTGSSVYNACNNPSPLAAPFVLQRTCNLLDADRMEIKAIVSWTDAKGTHQSQLITYLTKW